MATRRNKRLLSRLYVPHGVAEAVRVISSNTGETDQEIIDKALFEKYGDVYTKPRDLRNEIEGLRGS